jgi:hypothetical protein
MPITEPGQYRPSNLTKKQQQEQLAACYGVTMPTQQLTEVEVANMRRILAQHDGQSKPMITTDLNNPPHKPYRFEKFPMIVYDLQNSHPARSEEQLQRNNTLLEVHIAAKVVHATVNSEEELAQAIEAGWSQEAPSFNELPEDDLKPQYANEAARVDEVIRKSKPRKPFGRAHLADAS